MTGDPADPRAVLDELRAGVSRLASDLYRLETEADFQPLRQGGGLTGESAALVAAASADVPGAWVRYSLLTDAVEHLASAVEDGDRDAAAAALGPSAAALPDGTRTSALGLLRAVRAEVDGLLRAGERLSAAWREAIPKLDAAGRRLAEARGTAAAIGVGRDPTLLAAAELVEQLAATAATDPLSVRTAVLDAAVDRACRRVGELSAAHSSLPGRLAAARRLVDELAALIPQGRDALDEARAKIAEPDGLLEPIDPGAVDAGFHGVRPWLARLEALAQEGLWLPVSEGLDAWEGIAGAWLANARAVVAANRAPLEQRAELRGRLEAYAAKAAATGRAEDPALRALHAAATDALYTQPCDLHGAADLVARYGGAIRTGRAPSPDT